MIAGLKKKKVKIVIIASDLRDNSDEKIRRAAKNAKVKVYNPFSSEELKHAIGQNRKVLGITDAGFSKSIVKELTEGV